MRIIVFALIVSVCSVAEAVQEHSVFRDMRLVISFTGDHVYPLVKIDQPEAGRTFTIYMFVPEASGLQTQGFEVGFGFLSSLHMFHFMEFLYGEAYDGSALFIDEEYPTVTALLLSKPTIPASGYIGSATFKILEDLPEGDRWILAWHASMGDPDTNQNDPLDCIGATLTLTGTPRYIVASIPGDLDLDGDVDFGDFLIFTDNFGKTGDPPNVPEPETVYITVTDTVYVDRGTADTPQMARARAMLGFWHFSLALGPDQPNPIDTFAGFLFGRIIHPDPEEWPELKGEKVVMGASWDGSIAAMGYNVSNEDYILSYKFADDDDSDDEYLEFKMVQGKPIGYWVTRDPQTFEVVGNLEHITNDSGKGYHPNSGYVYRLSSESGSKLAGGGVPEPMRLVERIVDIIRNQE